MLRDLQRDFAAVVAANDDRAAARLSSAIVGDGIDPRRRLAIYRNHFVVTLTDVMAATYPAVRALVGESCFAAAARRFVDGAPPRTPCLFEYGERFPAFLKADANLRALPYLADVARFEWAVNRARHSGRVAPVGVASMRAIAPARYSAMKFKLQPSLSLVDSRYPLIRIIEAAHGTNPGVVDLDEGGDGVVVWRAADGVVWRGVSRGEFALLAALAAGATTAEACDSVPAASGVPLAAVIAFLLDMGLIAELGTASAPPTTPSRPDAVRSFGNIH